MSLTDIQKQRFKENIEQVDRQDYPTLQPAPCPNG
jgi:hypothetical protein